MLFWKRKKHNIYNMWQGKNVFVTGGSGFIGSHLVEKLRKLGANVELCKIDLIKYNLAEQNFAKMDYIFHLAAYSPAVTDKVDNSLVEERNVKMTQNALQFAQSNKANFVFLSTSHVYPKANITNGHPWNEDEMKNDETFTPYGLSKQKCETVCLDFAQKYGINTIIVRLANVYGPGDMSNRFLPSYIRRVLGKESPLQVFGNRKTERDFVYIEDVVDGIISAGEYGKSEIFNLGSGQTITIEQIAEAGRDACGQENVEIQYNDISNSVAEYNVLDSSRAQRLLNYSPKISFDDGIKKAVEWYKNNKLYMSVTKEKFSEKVSHNGNLLAVVLRNSKLSEFGQSGEKAFFPTPLDFQFQLGVQNRSAGEIVDAHFHKPFENHDVIPAQEIFFVLSGKVRVDLYEKETKTKVEEVLLEKGDVMVANTGHGLEFLENGQLLVVKQGPYRGRDEEKIFIQS